MVVNDGSSGGAVGGGGGVGAGTVAGGAVAAVVSGVGATVNAGATVTAAWIVDATVAGSGTGTVGTVVVGRARSVVVVRVGGGGAIVVATAVVATGSVVAAGLVGGTVGALVDGGRLVVAVVVVVVVEAEVDVVFGKDVVEESNEESVGAESAATDSDGSDEMNDVDRVVVTIAGGPAFGGSVIVMTTVASVEGSRLDVSVWARTRGGIGGVDFPDFLLRPSATTPSTAMAVTSKTPTTDETRKGRPSCRGRLVRGGLGLVPKARSTNDTKGATRAQGDLGICHEPVSPKPDW